MVHKVDVQSDKAVAEISDNLLEALTAYCSRK
jgi:hypothetical protein